MTARQLQSIAQKNGTPVVLVDHNEIRKNYAAFKKHLPKVQAYYAVKANAEPAIVRTLYQAGASFDVASLPEFMLVYENIKHLAAKEQQDFRDFATVDAIKSLLPVVDNFERALQAKSEPADFRTGVELIYKQLQDVLTKLGVRAIAAKGEQFDPHVHEAIEMVETPDAADHEVVEEWQRGYKFKDRLLRPAMVKVAKNPGK